MFAVPLALRAWAQWRLLAWPLAANSGHIRTGRVVECAIIVARRPQPAGSLRASSSGTHCCFPPAPSALAERKGIWLSVVSSQATTGLVVGMYLSYPGNSATLRKEMFFSSILYWSSLEVGDFRFCQNLSFYIVASGWELLVWHHLRSVYWDCSEVSAPGLEMSYPRWGGRGHLLGSLPVRKRGKSAPVDLSALTLWWVFSFKKRNSK